uniref:Uncharacterized protein n=1 Tax=Anopheles culicifacies TaxID=139723 RepID=A0A182M4S2_9DIPT
MALLLMPSTSFRESSSIMLVVQRDETKALKTQPTDYQHTPQREISAVIWRYKYANNRYLLMLLQPALMVGLTKGWVCCCLAVALPLVSRHSHQPANRAIVSKRFAVYLLVLASHDTHCTSQLVVDGINDNRHNSNETPSKPVLRNAWNAVKHSFNRYSVIVIGIWMYGYGVCAFSYVMFSRTPFSMFHHSGCSDVYPISTLMFLWSET